MKFYEVYFYKENAKHEIKCRIYTDTVLTDNEIRQRLADIGFKNVSLSYVSKLKIVFDSMNK